MRQLAEIIVFIALVVAAVPSTATADWLFTPYIGSAHLDITDSGTRPVVGGAVSWMGPVGGFEVDLGDAPAFLESKADRQIDRSNLLTLMGNAVVRFPTASSRVRPYAVGGVGLIQTYVRRSGSTLEIGDENVGFNLGGGVFYFLNDRIGLRGDFRYFRALRNDDARAEEDALEISELQFLRGTFGVTFKF
jgi:opacity protein-like surface antigen